MSTPSYYVMLRDKYSTDSLAFDFDFSAWSFLASDPLASATVASTPSGLTISSPPAINAAGTKAQVVIAGGTSGTSYSLTCTATSTAGRIIVGEGTLLIR